MQTSVIDNSYESLIKIYHATFLEKLRQPHVAEEVLAKLGQKWLEAEIKARALFRIIVGNILIHWILTSDEQIQNYEIGGFLNFEAIPGVQEETRSNQLSRVALLQKISLGYHRRRRRVASSRRVVFKLLAKPSRDLRSEVCRIVRHISFVNSNKTIHATQYTRARVAPVGMSVNIIHHFLPLAGDYLIPRLRSNSSTKSLTSNHPITDNPINFLQTLQMAALPCLAKGFA